MLYRLPPRSRMASHVGSRFPSGTSPLRGTHRLVQRPTKRELCLMLLNQNWSSPGSAAGQQKFNGPEDETSNREPLAHEKKFYRWTRMKAYSKPHEVGVQIPRCVHSRAPAKGDLSKDPPGPGIRREAAEFGGSALLVQKVLPLHVGRDKEVIREYIQKREEEDARLKQLNLWR
jgi:hypothetical protein